MECCLFYVEDYEDYQGQMSVCFKSPRLQLLKS